MTDDVLDARPLERAEMHSTVLRTFADLARDEACTVVCDRNPHDLREQFDLEHPGSYGWHYLVRGPEEWRVRITKLSATPLPRILTDLPTATERAREPDASGAVWKLLTRDRDLDSNIVRLRPNTSIEAHTGPDLDVLMVVLDGTGRLGTELDTVDLSTGAVVWLPARSRRQFTAGPSGMTYLTVHPRRQSLQLQPTRLA